MEDFPQNMNIICYLYKNSLLPWTQDSDSTVLNHTAYFMSKLGETRLLKTMALAVSTKQILLCCQRFGTQGN